MRIAWQLRSSFGEKPIRPVDELEESLASAVSGFPGQNRLLCGGGSIEGKPLGDNFLLPYAKPRKDAVQQIVAVDRARPFRRVGRLRRGRDKREQSAVRLAPRCRGPAAGPRWRFRRDASNGFGSARTRVGRMPGAAGRDRDKSSAMPPGETTEDSSIGFRIISVSVSCLSSLSRTWARSHFPPPRRRGGWRRPGGNRPHFDAPQDQLRRASVLFAAERWACSSMVGSRPASRRCRSVPRGTPPRSSRFVR